MKLVDIKPDHFYTLHDGTIVRIDTVSTGAIKLVYVWEDTSLSPYPIEPRHIAAPYIPDGSTAHTGE